jgi:Hint module
VVFIPHGANKDRAVFTQITTNSGRDIKMTQNHVLPAGTCSLSPSPAFLPLVYASQVSVGDCIMTVEGQETVLTVEKVRGEGLYTVVTNEVKPKPCLNPSPPSLLSFSSYFSYPAASHVSSSSASFPHLISLSFHTLHSLGILGRERRYCITLWC